MDFYGSKGLQVGLTALTGANLSSRFMWCRGLQPSLNWADSYSCFKSFQPPQKALLLNSTVYRYSISFLLVSQIVGATLGYFLGKIVFRPSINLQNSTVTLSIYGGLASLNLYTFYSTLKQFRQTLGVIGDWLFTPWNENPVPFKVQFYDKVLFQNWINSDTHIKTLASFLFGAVALPLYTELV